MTNKDQKQTCVDLPEFSLNGKYKYKNKIYIFVYETKN